MDLLELLVRDKIISSDIARKLQKRRDKSISEIIVDEGILGEVSYVEYISRTFGFKTYEGEEWDKFIVRLFPRKFLEENMFFPLKSFEDEFGKKVLVVVSSEPFNLNIGDVKNFLGVDKVITLVGSPKVVKNVISSVFTEGKEGGVKEYLEEIIKQGIEEGATDIHIGPYESDGNVRGEIKFRVDGVLVRKDVLSLFALKTLINRIKISAGLDISQTRIPQDGSFSFGKYDIRISFIPTIFGEKCAMRILKKTFDYSINTIGVDEEEKRIILRNLKKQGFILVVGPTGSGKTTTIYSILKEIDRERYMVFSIEDPPEYKIDGVNQIKVDEGIGLTFSRALRHVLRQDPDVIFVGEIRDFESADIAIKSALTGHLVLTTIHAKDVAGGIMRLIDIGIPFHFVISAITLGISQRLIGFGEERRGVFEVIEFDDEIKEEIRREYQFGLTETRLREIFKRKFKLLPKIDENILKSD